MKRQTKPVRSRIVRNKGLRSKVLERDQGFCANGCGYDPKWEHDHIVSLAIGGRDDIENSRTLCRNCHRAKTAPETTQRAKADRLAVRDQLTRRRRALPP